jgi:hypothetical protein
MVYRGDENEQGWKRMKNTAQKMIRFAKKESRKK